VIFAVLVVSFWALTTVVKLPWKFFTLMLLMMMMLTSLYPPSDCSSRVLCVNRRLTFSESIQARDRARLWKKNSEKIYSQPFFYSGHCYVEGMKKTRLSTNLSLHLVNDTRYDHIYSGKRIKTRIRSIDWCHFQWLWTTPNPDFKVTPLFNV